ncbi:MAG: DUF1643 domain-containing protein [Pseudomonadota bacterium]
MTVTRHVDSKDGWREAVYSDCEKYRYSLTSVWEEGAPRLLYVMLNPSKATELSNDPTIERCERRARRLGYGAFGVVNLFGLRETSPARLKSAEQPEGPDNMAQIEAAAKWSDHVLAAWGVHGAHRNQGARVLPKLRDSGKPLFHLGLTKGGHPRHPLYVSYEIKPITWL